MKQLLLTLLFVAQVSFICIGQDAKLDSLQQNFENTTADSLKLDQLVKIIDYVKRKDISLVKKYAEIGIKLAENSQPERTLHFETYYANYIKKDSSVEAALNYLEPKVKSYKYGENEIKLKGISALAVYYTQSNQIEKGINAYSELINLGEKLDNKIAIASSTIGMVTLFMTQKMYEEAKPYMDKSEMACSDLAPPSKFACLGVSYHNLALYFNKTNNCDSALLFASKAIENKKKVNNIAGIITSLQIKGNCELKLGDTTEAINTTEYSIDLAQKSPRFKSNLVSSQLHLANLYSLTNQKTKLLKLWSNIEANKANIKRSSDHLNYLTIKTQVLRSQGKYETAYKTLQEKYEYVDSTRNKANAAVVSEMENKFESVRLKKENELTKLRAESAEQQSKLERRNTLLIALFSILVLILLLVLLNRFSLIKKQKKELNEAYEQLEISKKNELAVSNLKALQSQMNPHFIFNALNSVQDLVLLQDIRNSNKYLGKFSDLIRKILLSSKEQFIKLEEEIEILKLYLDLEKLRFGEEFNIEFLTEVSDRDLTEIELPAMFIQPYIENSIKHGLFHKEGEKKLKVHFFKEKNYLNCVVEDNGVGQEQAQHYKEKNLHLHTGFSTEAIFNRIRLLNETLNKKIECETIDLLDNNSPLGTKVILRFPL